MDRWMDGWMDGWIDQLNQSVTFHSVKSGVNDT